MCGSDPVPENRYHLSIERVHDARGVAWLGIGLSRFCTAAHRFRCVGFWHCPQAGQGEGWRRQGSGLALEGARAADLIRSVCSPTVLAWYNTDWAHNNLNEFCWRSLVTRDSLLIVLHILMCLYLESSSVFFSIVSKAAEFLEVRKKVWEGKEEEGKGQQEAANFHGYPQKNFNIGC